MSQARVGKHSALLPAGYRVPLAFRFLIYAPAAYSRRIRTFFYEMPPSRVRTYLIACYYHQLVKQLAEGNFRFLGAVGEDASLTVFDLGSHRGPDGWKQALSEWRETLDVDLEMSRLINYDGGRRSVVEIRFTGRGASSGIGVDDLNYFVVEIENGVAVYGRFCREKGQALEAAGLSE